MPRLLLLALATTLAACGPSASGLDPQAAVEAADTAIAAHDADRALALLTEAAGAGHLEAMRRVAEAHERGYIRTPYEQGETSANLAVTTWPGRAAVARYRYASALASRAEAGEPGALLVAALELKGSLTRRNGTWEADMTPVERDSLAALHARLDAMDVDRLPLWSIAVALADTAAARRHLDEAVEAAEPRACDIRTWFGSSVGRDLSTARGLASYYDALASCPKEGLVEDALAPLAENVRAGIPEAVALADSLRDLGVFDRHAGAGALFEESGTSDAG
ncbi:MAG: hypothetical protein AAGJ11_18795 [Bacteroidota bacterium]